MMTVMMTKMMVIMMAEKEKVIAMKKVMENIRLVRQLLWSVSGYC